MQLVAKNSLKSKMHQYLDTVINDGEDIVITEHSRPIARIIPFKRKSPPEKVFAKYRGKVRYKGNLCSPTSAEWIEK